MKRRASVSVLVLLSMTVLLTVSLGVSALTMNNMRRAQRDTESWLAFQAAQAGLELQIARAFASLGANEGVFVSDEDNLSADISGFAPGALATTVVAPQSDPAWAWVTCTVEMNGRTRSLRQLITCRDVSIWNNAVFAGTGASGKAINGNVDVRGSVHILGEGESYSDLNSNGKWDPAESYTDKNHNNVWDPGEPFTDANNDGVWSSQEPYNDTNKNSIYDPPLTQTDLNSSFSGNAYIGNNYSGMPLTLEQQITTAPRRNNIETLSSEVRVKHGQISISGSATMGTNAVVDGGTSKNTIDGAYVNDGFIGSKGASGVFSDNGTSNQYDLDHLGIHFPLISGIGAEPYTDNSGTTWPTHEHYLDARSLTIPVTTITASTAAFTYGPDAYGNSINFKPAAGGNPAVLTVQGVIRFPANVQIGSKDTIRFDGIGTIFAENDINLDGNLLPVNGKVFPTTARVGFIAKQNLNIATGNGSSQLSLMGAFYAQGKIVSAKQNQIAGTFVANFFDMGTNVPNIYQVPSLTHNLPPAMPGDQNYFTVRARVWRERNVAD